MKNDITMNKYQEMAARTINKDLSAHEALMHALHEIASECGEIHGHFQKVYQGHPMDEDALKLEVGDVIWGLAELCTVKGWYLGDIALANLKKLEDRYPDGFSAERSLHRKEVVLEDMSPVERQIYRTFCRR